MTDVYNSWTKQCRKLSKANVEKQCGNLSKANVTYNTERIIFYFLPSVDEFIPMFAWTLSPITMFPLQSAILFTNLGTVSSLAADRKKRL